MKLEELNDDITSNSSSEEETHQNNCYTKCKTNEDYYQAILNMNGLSINVLTQQETVILELIDKIDDPDKKHATILSYMNVQGKPQEPKEGETSKTDNFLYNAYDFKNVINRVNKISMNNTNPTTNTGFTE